MVCQWQKSIINGIFIFFIPGLGEIYTGKVLMGLGLIFLSLILSTVAIVLTLFAGILYIMVWIYAIYDSYMTAKTLNEG